MSCGEILGNLWKFWEILPQTCFHVEKNGAQKVHLWRKNDKYEVWSTVVVRALFHNCGVQSRMCQSRVKARSTTGRGVGAAEKVSICMWACGHVWGQASLFHLYKFLYICREGSSLSWLGRQAALPGNSGTDLGRKLNAEKLPLWGFWLCIYTTIFGPSLYSPLISKS